MKNKNLIISLVVVAVLVAAAFLFYTGVDSGILGDDVKVVIYTLDGVPTGGASASILFTANTSSNWYAHVALDLNNDGAFQDEEVIVQNQYAFIRKDYRNNIAFSLDNPELAEGDSIKTSVVLTKSKLNQLFIKSDTEGGQSLEGTASVVISDSTDILGINVEGASEDLKRGPAGVFSLTSARDAFAQGTPTIEVMSDLDTPDIDQGTMECAPTSAANGITSLVGEHGDLDDLPQNTRDMIDELKNDMNFDDGVLNRNFTAGKNAFVQRHNLPITTEMIEAPTMQQIADALSNGCAVEMSMRWVNSASGMKNTGHTVSAVGAYAEGTQNNQVAVHDPGTHDVPGADVLNSSNNVQAGDTTYIGIDYPGWDGIAFVDAIFIQCWDTSEESQTGLQTDTSETSGLLDGYNLENISVEMAFDHTNPGEYSEVYVTVITAPNSDVTATLEGPGLASYHTQTVTSDLNGQARFVWRINAYGEYSVTGSVGSGITEFSDSIIVN